MTIRLAVHWAAVTATAAVTSTAAAVPFTGLTASVIGTLAAAGVCLVGIAVTPIRKDSE